MSLLDDLQVSAEIKLLLCCLSIELDSILEERLEEIITSEIDWDKFLDVATKHGVMPLLALRLKSIESEKVPEKIHARLRYYYHLNSRHNKALFKELVKLLSILNASGIQAIPYKGPTLAIESYGNLEAREFGDLDIFMRPEDALKAKDILQLMSYRPKIALTEQQEQAYLKHGCEYNFKHSGKDITVEVHWAIAAGRYHFPLRFEDLATRIKSIEISERSISVFSIEDQLLILSFHGFKHSWTRLQWVTDIAMLVKNHNLDWDYFFARSSELGIQRIALLALSLAHHLLKSELPDEVMAKIRRDVIIRSMTEQAISSMLMRPKAHWTKAVIFLLRGRDRFRDQLLYFYEVSTLTPEPANVPNEFGRRVPPLSFYSLFVRFFVSHYFIDASRNLIQRFVKTV